LRYSAVCAFPQGGIGATNGNGKWQMANGKWQMANGKWQMANGNGNGKCRYSIVTVAKLYVELVRLFSLFCFVLFCFVLFCFVLFCFVLFCFVHRTVTYCGALSYVVYVLCTVSSNLAVINEFFVKNLKKILFVFQYFIIFSFVIFFMPDTY
jgi:hypothetical protein